MLKSLDQELRGPWVIHHSAVLPLSCVRWENIPNMVNVFAGPFSLGLLWDSRWYFQSFSLSKIIKWWVVSSMVFIFWRHHSGQFWLPTLPKFRCPPHPYLLRHSGSQFLSYQMKCTEKKIALFADDLRHCIKTFSSYLSKGISFHNRGAQGIVFKALKSNRNSNADIFFLYSGWSSALESSRF